MGRAPTLIEFVGQAGIARRSILRFFSKWNDAVRAAGLKPNRLYVRPEDDELLKDWGATARKKRAAPSWREYRREGKFHPRTLENRFGGWRPLPEAFRNFAKGKREWDDVVALLPARVRSGFAPKFGRQGPNNNSVSLILPCKAAHAPLEDRTTYGNHMDFAGMRHEPVNEQGVVLLFGMLAKDLGYVVENVQKGFPDCEAKRQIGPERWQRVQIEFEFESKNYRDHGHPHTGCDVIVCWHHNWDDCPKHLEILELSRAVNSFG
jgi:hypothetical protein